MRRAQDHPAGQRADVLWLEARDLTDALERLGVWRRRVRRDERSPWRVTGGAR